MIYEKRILIIGNIENIENYLIKQLYTNNQIVIICKNEGKQIEMKNIYNNIKFFIGDIKNKKHIEHIIININPNIIIIGTEIKDPNIYDTNIIECIETNIIGTRNIIDIINENKLDKIECLLYISNNKTSIPITTYDMTKSISEKLMCEASMYNKKTKFVCIRYGNILEEIIEKKESKYNIINKNMTKFFITIENIIRLICDIINYGNNGEIWIPKMRAFKIIEILKLYGKQYNKTKIKDKLHEIILNKEEINRTYEITIDNKYEYYVIDSVYNNCIQKNNCILNNEYTSENISDINEVKNMLNNYLNIIV